MVKELITMTAAEGRETIREIMAAYDTAKAVWVKEFGTEDGFDDAFARKSCLMNNWVACTRCGDCLEHLPRDSAANEDRRAG